MDKALRDFIEEQRKKGINPAAIKIKLLNAGWPEKLVDDAMKEYFKEPSKEKKKSNPLIAIFALIVIVALGAVILVVTLKPIVPPENPDTPDVPDVPSTPGGTTGCANVDSSVKKDLCYQDLVAKGFDCGNLKDEVEKAFCFRALDYYLTTS